MTNKGRYGVFLLVLSTLVSCVGLNSNVPVIERTRLQKEHPKFHSVQRGETLYSIAWLYGMDYRRLANANKITAPFKIKPGQKLYLHSVSKAKYGVSKGSNFRSGKGTNTPPAKVAKKQIWPAKQTSRTAAAGGETWRWPAKGRLIKGFSVRDSVNKGIDIAGNLGEAVHCTRDGKVVYAGSGLVGYGKLIIVKHEKDYLSAYAHSSKLLVREGDLVKAGEKIAEIGDSGKNQPMLHFEIRKDGKPVNPLMLLPRK